MTTSYIDSLLGKNQEEPLISVDIGSSNIKLMELAKEGEGYRLISAGIAPTPAGAISNNTITKPEEVAEVIRSIVQSNDIKNSKVATVLPAPTAFTKKVKLQAMSPEELDENIQFEAGNYIPHNLSQVFLDYQILSAPTGSTMDVLLVAVKQEVVSSYLETLEKAELEPVLVDVDFFALETMFEINYPEQNEKTVAIVNIGNRFSAVDIIQKGENLFSGDVSVGGLNYTQNLVEKLDLKSAEAERCKFGEIPDEVDENLVTETLERTNEHVAGELQRQLGFFWNAAATEETIEEIYLCGGSSVLPGLLEELGAKTGLNCKLIESFRGIQGLESFDSDYLGEISPMMGLSVGLASRRLGDKPKPKAE